MEIWNTFDKVRGRLQRQYFNISFDKNSGMSVDELTLMAEKYQKENKNLSKIIIKANTFKMLLLNAQITVDPKDFFADKINVGISDVNIDEGKKIPGSMHSCKILQNLRENWTNDVKSNELFESAAFLKQGSKTGYIESVLDLGHLSPGWSTFYKYGLRGLINIAKKNLERDLSDEQKDFYTSVEIVYEAIIAFANRLADYAIKIIPENAEDTKRLEMVSKALRNVPENPPKSFHEALMFAYIMHQMIEMEGEFARSMGGFDRLYYTYYKNDIDNGTLSRDQAKELIKFFFTKFFAHTQGQANGKNFYLAGQLPDAGDGVNELTYLMLEAYEELETTDPKLSVRFHKNTPLKLYYTIAKMLKKGLTSFVLINDDVAIPAIVKQGKTLSDARDFLLIGCYEPAIEGREVACNMSGKINLSKGVELALNNGIDPISGIKLGPSTGDPLRFQTYDEFYNAYIKQMIFQVEGSMNNIAEHEIYWPEINPSPVAAGSFLDCLDKGKDIGQGGAKYNNTGCMGAALANTADSLYAVKRLVFDDNTCTMNELIEALESDFIGYEELQTYILNELPKWGNNHDGVDQIAVDIADKYSNKVNNKKNNRGGYFQASLFSLTHRHSMGKLTGALPDGRKRGESLSCNLDAMIGMDKKGVTSLINSVTKLDFTNIPNGSVLGLCLHPSAVQGDEGLDALVNLIRTYFYKGGYGLQFNIFDTEILKDAQANPQNHSTLQVRVCGWNVYFTALTRKEQNQFIAANKHVS